MVGWVGDDEGFESSFIFICGWAGGLECFPDPADFPSSSLSLVAVLLFVAHVLPGIPMFYPSTNSCATPLEKLKKTMDRWNHDDISCTRVGIIREHK